MLLPIFLSVFLHAAYAQQSKLSYVDSSVCCIAPDGHGNNFVVSSWYPDFNVRATKVSVAKLDSGGNVVSKYIFDPGAAAVPASAVADSQGNLWIAGSTTPTAPNNAPTVGLLLEFDPTGTAVLFSGTFGGVDIHGRTQIGALAFDPAGNLYLAGLTNQLDFPLTQGAFLSTLHTSPGFGPDYPGRPIYGFIAKLKLANNASTPYSVVYSTLLGGYQVPEPVPTIPPLVPITQISALAVDASGVATVGGITSAADFPVTAGAFQTQFTSTSDNTPEVFVTRLNAQGSGLVWSTLVGAGTFSNPALGLILDAGANVVFAGVTQDHGFPVTSGAIQTQFIGPNGEYNNFLAKLDPSGARLLFSTFYGLAGSQSTPRLDAEGNIWITRSVRDPAGLVLVPNSLMLGTAAIAEIAPDGSSVLFSELLPNGIAGQDLVLNPDGSMTVAGTNGFVLHLPRSTPMGVSLLGVADSAAAQVTKWVAPGEYLTIYGTGLGPATAIPMQIDADGRVAHSLGGTQVSVGGVPAPLLYVSNNQINALVPYQASGLVNLAITTASGSSQVLPLQVVQAQPNIFAILNSDGSVNSASNPAPQNTSVSILVSGAGFLNPSLPDGTISAAPGPAPALPVQVSYSSFVGPFVSFQKVTPSYAGSIPGVVASMLRVDVGFPGFSCSACSASVLVGNATSPPFRVYGAAPKN